MAQSTAHDHHRVVAGVRRDDGGGLHRPRPISRSATPSISPRAWRTATSRCNRRTIATCRRSSAASTAAPPRARASPPTATWSRVVPRISGQLVVATATEQLLRRRLRRRRSHARRQEHLRGRSASIVDGHVFAGADGIVLGKTLAKNLGAAVGRKVVYTLTDKQPGEIVSGPGRASAAASSPPARRALRRRALPPADRRRALAHRLRRRRGDAARRLPRRSAARRKGGAAARRLGAHRGRCARLGGGEPRSGRLRDGEGHRLGGDRGVRGAAHRRRHLQHAVRQRDGAAARVRHPPRHRLLARRPPVPAGGARELVAGARRARRRRGGDRRRSTTTCTCTAST